MLKPSTCYSSKADLDIFDCWALEVKTWVRLNRLTAEIAITVLNKCVPGRARHLVHEMHSWQGETVEVTAVFEGLFCLTTVSPKISRRTFGED